MSFFTQPRPTYFVLLTFALIVASRVIAVLDGRDPGFDQAMLMASFPLDGSVDYFKPLPYYEQGTALGSVVQLDLITTLFGSDGLNRFFAARIWAASAAILSYAILYRLLSRSLGPRDAAFALVLMASPLEMLLFTTNPKNYVNAFLFCCLLIAAADFYLANQNLRRAGLFVLSVLGVCLFSLTAPISVAAVGAGMIAVVLARSSDNGTMNTRLWTSLVRLVYLGAASFAICLVFYLAFTKPITAFDQAAYSNRYVTAYWDVSNPFGKQSLQTLKDIFHVFYQMVEPSYLVEILSRFGAIGWREYFGLLFAVFSILGARSYWRKAKLFFGGLVGGGLVIFSLNAASILPIVSTRHFMFFAPFAVPCFVLGVVSTIEFLLRQVRLKAWTTTAVATMTIAIGAAAVIKAGNLENTEVSEHLDLIESYPAPLWVYYGAQPSLHALRPKLFFSGAPRVIGVLPYESSIQSWTVSARGEDNHLTSESYYATSAELLRGTQPVWLLFAHFWPERRTEQGLDRFIDMAQTKGRVCRRRTSPGGMVALCTLPAEFPFELADRLD